MPEDIIQLRFTRAEALVLFEWLVTFDESEAGPPQDSAEQRALWRLEAKLEKTLVEILLPNYQELLDDARTRLLSSNAGDVDNGEPGR